MPTPSSSPIEELAFRQLAAYNNFDLDGFCACYHKEVRMFDGEELELEGIETFRARYADMFAHGGFGGTVSRRLSVGQHCVDEEEWWRMDPETGERQAGVILVRYVERDGKIGLVQFLG
jgi:hypothetical protein